MEKLLNLKEIERRAFRSTFQDGLWDIYLGLLLLAMAIGALLSDLGATPSPLVRQLIYVGLIALSVLVLWRGKKVITIPRMGLIKFGPRRRKKLGKVTIVLGISVLLGLFCFVVAANLRDNPPEWLKFGFPAVWAVNCLVVFSLMAYFLDFPRLYFYGVLYAVPLTLDSVLKRGIGSDLTFIAFGIPALVILSIGVGLLVRFLRRYPVPAEETVNVNS